MGKAILSISIIAGAFFLSCQSSLAESYQALAIQKAALYGEKVEVSEAEKNHLLSSGQEYIRYYLRDEMLRSMAGRWLAVDDKTLHTGFKFDLHEFYQKTPGKAAFRAEMCFYADEDLQKYMNCGYFLPVEIEIDSSLMILPNMEVKAKIEAPFDDVMRFQLGSKIDWNQKVSSSIQYRLSNSSQSYQGLTLGMGIQFLSWRCKVNYELTAEMNQVQHFSIAKDF